eukprot:scaffold786_cov329-Pavlova_lutheri.AAC.21
MATPFLIPMHVPIDACHSNGLFLQRSKARTFFGFLTKSIDEYVRTFDMVSTNGMKEGDVPRAEVMQGLPS